MIYLKLLLNIVNYVNGLEIYPMGSSQNLSIDFSNKNILSLDSMEPFFTKTKILI